MTRDEQEMIMWREAYMLAISQGASYGDADEAATTAAESFRKRYPAEPTAPPAVWYDEPPFEKDDADHPCWIEGEPIIAYVYWDSFYGALQWLVEHHGGGVVALNGRRVCPIAKPPEPTT